MRPMPTIKKALNLSDELLLGTHKTCRVSIADQRRQRQEAVEILKRIELQPGVILADEVGMGKTFVALAVAYAVAVQYSLGPVVVMVPKNLVDKWCRDLDAFCELYLPNRKAVNCRNSKSRQEMRKANVIRYSTAYHSVEYLKLLDDPKSIKCHLIFLAHGAMSRGLNDEWVRLSLIQETLKRHGRRRRLSKVRKQIHRFLAELLWIKFRQTATSKKDKIWQLLLTYDPSLWKSIYNSNIRSEKDTLKDDPVPKAVLRALGKIDLEAFAEALEKMPVRTSTDPKHLSERIQRARGALRKEEEQLWKQIISDSKWRSPLLIMDEAHHLKNPGTQLARQLQCPESEDDLRVGDGALSNSFDRMLFLTATPFQLGHHELVRVLRRFGDVRWNSNLFGTESEFHERLDRLMDLLSVAQLSSIRLFKAWNQLRPEDFPSDDDISKWWETICKRNVQELSLRQKLFHDTLTESRNKRELAQTYLRPWIIRHNKGDFWPGTFTYRRERLEGAKILQETLAGGLDIPQEQLMPFFLAARSASGASRDILGEALSSSYEAFRFTRLKNREEKDDVMPEDNIGNLTQAAWFLEEFDRSLEKVSGWGHPKMNATVNRVLDLWELGEKVLIFAFYRQTCRSLRVHISAEMERRILTHARRRLAGAGRPSDDQTIEAILYRIQTRFFDTRTYESYQALDRALTNILAPSEERLKTYKIDPEIIKGIMRRFLRVRTTLVRAFPIHRYEEMEPHLAVRSMLDSQDKSGMSWRDKFNLFLDFLIKECSTKERLDYIDAANKTQTGRIRVQRGEQATDIADEEDETVALTLANIQVATGTTKQDARSRLMLAFNTPFFPDVLVCSRVMGEGIDLHRYCRYVIHHDLDWNPSDIEQRTGRIDRLGCKAEGKHPIAVYLPYLSGTADERQYLVMTEREKWFRIVMGQEEVAKLIPSNDEAYRPLPPDEFQKMLVFNLHVY
jgi:superfamily II DNA or RNA helicase